MSHALVWNCRVGERVALLKKAALACLIGGLFAAIWDADESTSLTWGKGYALVTRWNGDEDNFVLDLVDNGFEWFNSGLQNI